MAGFKDIIGHEQIIEHLQMCIRDRCRWKDRIHGDRKQHSGDLCGKRWHDFDLCGNEHAVTESVY